VKAPRRLNTKGLCYAFLSATGANKGKPFNFIIIYGRCQMEGTTLQILVYLFSAGMTIGTVLWRIKELEKKVDKHNGLVERMVVVEQSSKSAHHRLDRIEKVEDGA